MCIRDNIITSSLVLFTIWSAIDLWIYLLSQEKKKTEDVDSLLMLRVGVTCNYQIDLETLVI